MEFLDKKSFDMLVLFSERDAISFSGLAAIHNVFHLSKQIHDPLQTLRERGFVEIHHSAKILDGDAVTPTTPLVITREGRSFLEETRSEKKRELWANIRYAITTAIAVAALVVAIIALSA